MVGPKSLKHPQSGTCCSSLLGFRFATLLLSRHLIVDFEAHVNGHKDQCGSQVILSGVNCHVIMSGYGNHSPDDEGRETSRSYPEDLQRGDDDGRGGAGAWGL